MFINIHNSNCFDLVVVLEKMQNQLSQIHQLGVSLADSYNETRYSKANYDYFTALSLINLYNK
jgi:hypothetical protein